MIDFEILSVHGTDTSTLMPGGRRNTEDIKLAMSDHMSSVVSNYLVLRRGIELLSLTITAIKRPWPARVTQSQNNRQLLVCRTLNSGQKLDGACSVMRTAPHTQAGVQKFPGCPYTIDNIPALAWHLPLAADSLRAREGRSLGPGSVSTLPVLRRTESAGISRRHSRACCKTQVGFSRKRSISAGLVTNDDSEIQVVHSLAWG